MDMRKKHIVPKLQISQGKMCFCDPDADHRSKEQIQNPVVDVPASF